MYSGFPKPTSVSQETDMNYSLFRYLYWQNVEKFARDHEQLEKSTSISTALVGMFLLGGTDPETSCKHSNAFAEFFCKANNLKAWKKVGVDPLTRACLDDSKVRHEIGACDDEDPIVSTL